MNLLDQAVKMAAEADEPVSMNYVRKHAYSRRRKWALTPASGDRVFSMPLVPLLISTWQ